MSAAGVGSVAGCTTDSDTSTPSSIPTETSTPTKTYTPATTDAPQENTKTWFVGPDGLDTNPGTRDEPLETIQAGLRQARPGDTVFVLPGEYFQDFQPIRDGTPDAPIEITGPRDAVIHGAGSRSDGIVVFNTHSHIHITGLTFDGLWRPDEPNDPNSYRDYLIWTRAKTSEYLTDVKIKPHAVGNARYSFIDFNMTNNVEVGEFEVIGPAGASYVVGDAVDHEGEIVYVGSPPVEARNLQEDGILDGADTSHNYHIHHIDNSAGYAHSELVNTKAGTYDVLVEYCTDGGGGYVTDEATNASVAIAGHDSTVRWNDLQGSPLPDEAKLPTHGVSIDSGVPEYCTREDGPQQCVGFGNAIYGNQIKNFDDSTEKLTGHAVFFEGIWVNEWRDDVAPNVGPDDQKALCGNEYNGPTHSNPASSCSDEIPDGDGIGHTGGASPWN